MRETNRATHSRMFSLSERMEKLATARVELVRQLAVVDSETKAIQTEYNVLYNSTLPASVLPSELLAMIFDAAIHTKQGFEITISHVSHHWRSIVLETPQFWATIRQTMYQGHDDRIVAYLDRSKAAPINLFVEIYKGNVAKMCHFIDIHIGHCRELRVSISDPNCNVPEILECLSSQHAPLKLFNLCFARSTSAPLPPRKIFAGGAPLLTSVMLDYASTPICLPPLASLTAIHLDFYHMSSYDDACRLRDMIVAPISLWQLELKLAHSQFNWPLDVALPLPALHALEIEGPKLQMSRLLTAVHAPSLQMLHLTGHYPRHLSNDFEQSSLLSWPTKFPNLHTLKYHHHEPPRQHGARVNPLREVALRFPGILHLTCVNEPGALLSALQEGQDPIWPHLQTLGLPWSKHRVSVETIQKLLNKRIHLGHPIRTVLLKKSILKDDLQGLRRLARVEMYVDDWPNPFSRCP